MENTEFKAVKFLLELALCRILLVWRGCIYIYIYIPSHQKSSLVYLFNSSCGLHYIGRISQNLDVSIKQHRSSKFRNLINLPTDALNNTYGSSIADYLVNNRKYANEFSVDLFSILSKAHSPFHLKILEILYIRSWLHFNYKKKCLNLM